RRDDQRSNARRIRYLRQLRLQFHKIINPLQEAVTDDQLRQGQHDPGERRSEQRAQLLDGDGEYHASSVWVRCTNTSSMLVCAGVNCINPQPSSTARPTSASVGSLPLAKLMRNTFADTDSARATPAIADNTEIAGGRRKPSSTMRPLWNCFKPAMVSLNTVLPWCMICTRSQT